MNSRPLPPRRSLLRICLWALVGLLILAAGLVYIAGTTVTLQWAAHQAVRLSDGRLEVDGIAGSVLSEIVADSVRWQDDGVGVTITSPRFTYHPFALFDGLIRIERVSAVTVEVELPPAAEPDQPRLPVRLPRAMAALLPAAIERIDADRVVVRRAGRDLLELHNLELVLRHDGDRFNASLLNADVLAGAQKIGLRGAAAVLSRAPYATDGRLAVNLPMEPEPLRLDVRINGPIEELSIRATTTFGGAPVDARTVLHALDPRPLRQVRIELKDFDLARYDASLPATRLSGSYDAEVLPAWSKERQPLLIGPLSLANAMAGPINRGRIPIEAAKAVVGVVDGRLEVHGLQAGGPLGDVAGDGWVGRDGFFGFSLSGEKLQLQAIDSNLAPRTLAAKVTLGPVAASTANEPPGVSPGGRHGLDLHIVANDSAVAAELRGVVAGARLRISRAQVRLKAKEGAGQAGFSGTVGLAAPWPVDLNGDFRSDFHDFRHLGAGRLAAKPAALLNGAWRVTGRLAGDPGGRLEAAISLADGRLQDLPLSGTLAATLALAKGEPQRLSAVEAELRWGSGSAQVRGALGEGEDTLRVALDLPDMGQLQEGMAGSVNAHGVLHGSLLAPAVEASIDGRRLFANTGGMRVRIDAASLQMDSAKLLDGALKLRARLENVDLVRTVASGSGGEAVVISLLGFDRVTAGLDGTPADHVAHLDAAGAEQNITLATKGGLAGNGTWRGSFDKLAVSHPHLRMPADGAVARAAAAGVSRQDTAVMPGAHDFESLQPFDLTIGNGRADVRDGRFNLQGATLSLKRLQWHDSKVMVSAEATDLAARWLSRYVNLSELYRARGAAIAPTAASADPLQDLRLAAAVEFAGDLADPAAAGWRGSLQFRRESGDLSLPGTPGAGPDRAGLRTFEAGASIDANVVDLVVNVDGDNIGRVSGEARTTLQRGGEPPWAEASLARSPLRGRVDLETGSFRWISPLAGSGWNVDGALSARLQVVGTLTRPRVEGIVTGNNLSAQEQAFGMRLGNGVLAAELAGERVDVKLLRFESGMGSVAISGLLQPPGNGRSEARIVVDSLPISMGAGQRVVLSGSTTATLEERAMRVTGRLVADEGVVELKGFKALEGSQGMQGSKGLQGVQGPKGIQGLEGAEGVQGVEGARSAADSGTLRPAAIRKTGIRPMARTAHGSAAGRTSAMDPGFGIDTDVEVDFGRGFRAFGSGLDAYLRGAVRLRGSLPEVPRAAGTVEIVNGTFQPYGYGSKLTIRQGKVVFDGPLDNPTLDIVAVRENLNVVPGVAIGGSAVAPAAKLISDPEVADADKLSWLVLGTGLQDARGTGQRLALQAAATMLFGVGSDRYLPWPTDPLGIDLFSAREQAIGYSTEPGGTSERSQGAAVMAGMRLASCIFMTVEQSLRAVWSILKLQYEVTDRLSSSVKAGSDGASDLLRFFPFD